LIQYPSDLPITARREDILAALRAHPVVVLAGETGSGKTTQIPKLCLELLEERGQGGRIGCTQPRRVAALSVSKRVAEELGVDWGGLVGCKMRFSDDTRRDTRVKFMTDGILLAEIQSDPLLRAYSVLILDEAHERSLNIDFLLGYLKQLLPRRPDLKLVVTSATIDTEAFSAHFGGAPIIEVSGRLYPVEIRHQPMANDDADPVEAAVRATEAVLRESHAGDVLVFMPTERDIRETRDLLEGRLGPGCEVLTLFGRMASQDQQRVFAPGAKRRVIIATNVAETSITLPRIRYVIDTGLARISRYNARTRTKRLPVEAVSQSSANQRAGRAGRLQDGVCIRLYSEEDFLKRPRFTQPEIQRANLAEVILRMKAFRLGRIEDFPFLNPPSAAAIRGGYDLLHELGALDDTHEMTGLGRELARLPLDPTLGRMLLQAREEGCLADMLIIASGLSIPDPRERPEDKKELAQAAHKAFASPESDFMSLLKIWQAAPPPSEGSRNSLRRFCKANFLSFTRLTEWRDLWRQLSELFPEASSAPAEENPGNRLHRCILAGHLGHLAQRSARNQYKAAGNREVTLFPGSHLYERRDRQDKKGQEKTRQPEWIVAAEIVQTSQLFARTVAGIQPEWAAEFGAHLTVKKYSEPHWSAKAGRVLVSERHLLYGLEVLRRKIDFGKIDPQAATQLFIRGALLDEGASLPHRFFQHNQKLRNRLEAALTRVRSSRVHAIEERLYEFYRANLPAAVSSIHDLNKLLQEHRQPDFLCAREEDLTRGEDVSEGLDQFPDQAPLGNAVLPLAYAYKPGQEDDGVTVRVPLPVAEHLSSGQVQWLVPGLREEIALTLLRALPKTMRRSLMPIEASARAIAREFDPGRADFFEAFAAFLRSRHGLQVNASDWPADCLPAHLRPRLEVVGAGDRPVLATRDLASIQELARRQTRRSDAWEKAVTRFEKHGLQAWSFGDLPEKILVEEIGGAPVFGYPGLAVSTEGISLRLFRRPAEAIAATPAAVRRLAEEALARDLAWLRKELRSLDAAPAPKNHGLASLSQLDLTKLATPAAPTAASPLSEQAYEHLLAHSLRLDPLLPLKEARFRDMLEHARREWPALAHRMRELLRQTEALRQQILAFPRPYTGLQADLARLLPPDLLLKTPHSQLQHLPRYLKAVLLRAERAANHPAKDADKAERIREFDGWEQEVPAANRETFRWLFEEYRVSIFAQELGTAQPVSVKRLEALITG
jgi:ATP-dependent helicase HrpA